jgi:hypothetical protein
MLNRLCLLAFLSCAACVRAPAPSPQPAVHPQAPAVARRPSLVSHDVYQLLVEDQAGTRARVQVGDRSHLIAIAYPRDPQSRADYKVVLVEVDGSWTELLNVPSDGVPCGADHCPGGVTPLRVSVDSSGAYREAGTFDVTVEGYAGDIGYDVTWTLRWDGARSTFVASGPVARHAPTYELKSS